MLYDDQVVVSLIRDAHIHTLYPSRFLSSPVTRHACVRFQNILTNLITSFFLFPYPTYLYSSSGHPTHTDVYIYYRDGGVRKLFRKKKNQASIYVDSGPESHLVRTDSDYIYEEFFEADAYKDVKVYGVGPTYLHAEARKAPHIDGVVERDLQGFEVRSDVTLSASEYAICARVSAAFDQLIIGFDLLRTAQHGAYYVIDVNGWSIVKNNTMYTENCARILSNFILRKMHERQSLYMRALSLPDAPSHAAADLAIMFVLDSYNTTHHLKQSAATFAASQSHTVSVKPPQPPLTHRTGDEVGGSAPATAKTDRESVPSGESSENEAGCGNTALKEIESVQSNKCIA